MDSITMRRRKEILQELARGEPVTVADLSRRFRVSEVSIRRDLQKLETRGLLKRVHGGAIPVSPLPPEAAVPRTADPMAEKKERIGRAGAQLISRGDRIILDSGSTVLQVATQIDEELLLDGRLTVITGSLPAISRFESCPGVHMIVLGGVFLHDWKLMVGPQTIDVLRNLHADKFFLGTDGLSFTRGFTTANVLEAEVVRAMAQAATQVIVVTDSSKFGRIGLATTVPIGAVHTLITDTDAPADFLARMRDEGVEVILV